MTDNAGLLYGWILDGKGSGKQLGWDEIDLWTPEQGVLWIHLEYSDSYVHDWLLNKSGLDDVTAEALLADETRPRSILNASGLLLTLRGMNPNPDANPEDMVAVRLWSDGNRIITTRRRKLQTTSEISDLLDKGKDRKSVV